MKFNKFLLVALTATLVGSAAFAAGYDDDDDIYYNPAKAKKEIKASQKINTKKDKRGTIVTGNDGNEYVVTEEGMAYPVQAVNFAGSDAYIVNSGNTRDVDEYNRRSCSKASGSLSSSVTTREDFANTRQIERYYNPDIVVATGDDDLIDLYYTQAQPQEVNIYIDATPSWNSFYGPTYSAWNYWNNWGYWNNWNWYTNSYYYPSLAWSWGWSYNPWWGYGYNPWWTPSWSWSWGGYYPGYYPAPRPWHGPSHSPAGSYRPHRPGSNYAGATRPGGNRGNYPSVGGRPANNNQGGYGQQTNNQGGYRGQRPGTGTPNVSTGTTIGSNMNNNTGNSGFIGRPSTGSNARPGNGSNYRGGTSRPNASTVIGSGNSSGRGQSVGSGSSNGGGRRGSVSGNSSTVNNNSGSRRSTNSSSYNTGRSSSSSSMGSGRSSSGGSRGSSGGSHSGGGRSGGGGRR